MNMSEHLAWMAALTGGVAGYAYVVGRVLRPSRLRTVGVGLLAVGFMLHATSAALIDDDRVTAGSALITLALALRFLMLVRAAPSGGRR